MHPLPPALADLVAASRRRDLLAAAETRRTAALDRRHVTGLGRPALVNRREPRGEAAAIRTRV